MIVNETRVAIVGNVVSAGKSGVVIDMTDGGWYAVRCDDGHEARWLKEEELSVLPRESY